MRRTTLALVFALLAPLIATAPAQHVSNVYNRDPGEPHKNLTEASLNLAFRRTACRVASAMGSKVAWTLSFELPATPPCTASERVVASARGPAWRGRGRRWRRTRRHPGTRMRPFRFHAWRGGTVGGHGVRRRSPRRYRSPGLILSLAGAHGRKTVNSAVARSTIRSTPLARYSTKPDTGRAGMPVSG